MKVREIMVKKEQQKSQEILYGENNKIVKHYNKDINSMR